MVSGTQKGLTSIQQNVLFDLIDDFLSTPGPHEWRDGDCIGVDAECARYIHEVRTACAWDVKTFSHPGDLSPKRAGVKHDRNFTPIAPLARNRLMVERSTHVLIAPKESVEAIRSGTWATWRWARKKGRPWLIVYPDGTTEQSENFTRPS